MNEPHCSKESWKSSHATPCLRKATVTENGKPWCRQHAPSTVEAKRLVQTQRYDHKCKMAALEHKVLAVEREIIQYVTGTKALDGQLWSLVELNRLRYAHLRAKQCVTDAEKVKP